MKITTQGTKPEFTPFDVVIRVESEDEALHLLARVSSRARLRAITRNPTLSDFYKGLEAGIAKHVR